MRGGRFLKTCYGNGPIAAKSRGRPPPIKKNPAAVELGRKGGKLSADVLPMEEKVRGDRRVRSPPPTPSEKREVCVLYGNHIINS